MQYTCRKLELPKDFPNIEIRKQLVNWKYKLESDLPMWTDITEIGKAIMSFSENLNATYSIDNTVVGMNGEKVDIYITFNPYQEDVCEVVLHLQTRAKVDVEADMKKLDKMLY